MLAPAGLVFLIFFAIPFLVMATMSLLSANPLVQPNAEFTLRHYERMADDIYYYEVLWQTLRLGLLTTVLSLLLGYPLAFVLARMRSATGRTLVLMAVIAPMVMGLVVRTFAWLGMFSNRGLINTALQWLGLATEPVPFLGSEGAVVVALCHIYVPFMILTLTGVIARIDPRLEEAARGLGATKVGAFLQVTLPLSAPGILAGCLLVFALAISAYVTPIVIGNYEIQTLPMLIFQQVNSSFNLGFAAALGVVLLVVALVLVFAYGRAMQRAARGAM
ncbi:ABC transporter permease [Falsiroseomonas sp. HW251]|uniref:ABC transporter permease n=1 Tax=Falsiroseomonas sp. HW251 TaxID=3390998 RepID=UPI003D31C6F0